MRGQWPSATISWPELLGALSPPIPAARTNSLGSIAVVVWGMGTGAQFQQVLTSMTHLYRLGHSFIAIAKGINTKYNPPSQSRPEHHRVELTLGNLCEFGSFRECGKPPMRITGQAKAGWPGREQPDLRVKPLGNGTTCSLQKQKLHR